MLLSLIKPVCQIMLYMKIASHNKQKGGLYGCRVKNLILGPILGQKRALAPSQELARRHDKHKNFVYLNSRHEGSKKMAYMSTKKWFWCKKTSLLGPKRVILGNRGHETVRRAAKRPPTGKPKLSRVTSGYGGLTIPLSQIRLALKNGGYMGVA